MALVSLAPGARSVASARTPSRYNLAPRASPPRANNCKDVGVHGLAQRRALASGKYLARVPQPVFPLQRPPSLLPLKATYHDEPGSVERAMAVLTYTLPILDSIHYGQHFFRMVPAASKVLVPLQPLIHAYYSVPMISTVAFFGVYLGIVQNKSLSRFVRTSAHQSVLLSMTLMMPNVARMIFASRRACAPTTLQVALETAVWALVSGLALWGAGGALLGVRARMPLISDATDASVG